MTRAHVVEIPNAWGWHGHTDRAAYGVYVDGTLHGTYCYFEMAAAAALRLDGGLRCACARCANESGQS